MYWTSCAAHCIDLMLEDFEKKLGTHKVIIAKARKTTIYIYTRPLLIAILRQFSKGKDLIWPAITRFAIAYLTLGCVNDHKGVLMPMFTSKTWSKFVAKQDGK